MLPTSPALTKPRTTVRKAQRYPITSGYFQHFEVTMNKSFQFNGTSYVSSLPFINTQTGNWFDVTPTGDSKIDYNIGVNCAILLLKAMGQDNENFDYSPFKEGAKVIMPNVVKSIVKQGESLQVTILAP